MRIAVSAALCSGHGRCYSLAPELLHYDDEGFVTIRGSDLEVGEAQQTAARGAVAGCPEGAITIVE